MWQLSLPLVLLWLPWLLVNLILSLLAALIKRLFACCGAGPDAVPMSGDAQPVPHGHAYTGDIFGYAGYMGHTIVQLDKIARKLGSRVFTYNNGAACVNCGDVASVESIIGTGRGASRVEASERKHGISINFNTDYFAGRGPNQITNGEKAQRTRDFFLDIVPSSPKQELFREGIRQLTNDMNAFVSGAGATTSFEVLQGTLEDIIVTSISTMFFGGPLNLTLFKQLWPAPTVTPQYPAMPPKCLFPLHYRGKQVSIQLSNSIRGLPSFGRVSSAAYQKRITEEEAIGNLLCGISFNASGFVGPMLNAFIILPQLPKKGKDLVKDAELLESVAWELLRNCGPSLSYDTVEDTTVTTSEGVNHRVRKGTKLLSHLAFVQRDDKVWKASGVFKADRFKPAPKRSLARRNGNSEPLPTVGFGCPLGFIDDERQRTNSHQCVFARLAHPYMVDFLKILATFEWEIQGFDIQQVNSLLEFDLSASICKGGFGPDACVPKGAFQSKVRWMQHRRRRLNRNTRPHLD